ncbi:hypothetical protein ACB092_05G295200 [Castanea dentata]
MFLNHILLTNTKTISLSLSLGLSFKRRLSPTHCKTHTLLSLSLSLYPSPSPKPKHQSDLRDRLSWDVGTNQVSETKTIPLEKGYTCLSIALRRAPFGLLLNNGIILKENGKVGDAERMFIQARFFAPEKAKALVDRYSRQ